MKKKKPLRIFQYFKSLSFYLHLIKPVSVLQQVGDTSMVWKLLSLESLIIRFLDLKFCFLKNFLLYNHSTCHYLSFFGYQINYRSLKFRFFANTIGKHLDSEKIFYFVKWASRDVHIN